MLMNLGSCGTMCLPSNEDTAGTHTRQPELWYRFTTGGGD
jgi:hypothetical protein